MELARQKMHKNNLKIFVIAGEVSGDVLGGRIMENMPDVQFVGIGGQNMQAQGLKSLFPIADLAVMGVIEVLGRARTLMTRINQTVDAIIAEKPGFAKSVITKLKKSDAGQKLIKNGLRFHHVVAPQVWAWRPKRAKKYARLFDKLYAFFDFELPYFTKYGLDTVAVGHPIADGLIGRKVQTKFKSDKKIITLVPGSRMSEVKRLLPLMRDVADTLSRNGYVGYQFVIPTVETTREYVRTQVEKWRIKPILVDSESRYDVYSQTYIAIVASGTVSAELAMLHIPTIVVYKMNKITSWLIKRFIRVRWVSLVNILLNRSVYPEFLGPDATVDNVLGAVQQLTIPSVRSKMTKALTEADDLWCRSVGGAGQQIASYLYQA